MARRERRTTIERLRAEIDAGRQGDKVPAPDPATVPLGADEEAAGTPISPRAVGASASAPETSAPAPPRRSRTTPWLIAGIALLAVLVIGVSLMGA